MLNINNTIDGNKLTITLVGRMDTPAAASLEEELKDSLDNITEVIMDFQDLDYISSYGLRVLLTMQKNMEAKNGNMLILNVSESIKDIFVITGFDTILNYE